MSFKKRFQELLADKSLSENELCATIDTLLKDGIDPAVLLYMAVESDHLPAVKHLRELGADPASIVTDGKNPVSLAIDLDKWEIVEYFLSKDFNRIEKRRRFGLGQSNQLIDSKTYPASFWRRPTFCQSSTPVPKPA